MRHVQNACTVRQGVVDTQQQHVFMIDVVTGYQPQVPARVVFGRQRQCLRLRRGVLPSSRVGHTQGVNVLAEVRGRSRFPMRGSGAGSEPVRQCGQRGQSFVYVRAQRRQRGRLAGEPAGPSHYQLVGCTQLVKHLADPVCPLPPGRRHTLQRIVCRRAPEAITVTNATRRNTLVEPHAILSALLGLLACRNPDGRYVLESGFGGLAALQATACRLEKRNELPVAPRPPEECPSAPGHVIMSHHSQERGFPSERMVDGLPTGRGSDIAPGPTAGAKN